MASNELEKIKWIAGDELTAQHLNYMSDAIIGNNDSIDNANNRIESLSKNIQSAALNPYSRHVASDIGDMQEGNKAYYNSGYDIACNPVGINVNVGGAVGTNISDYQSDTSLGDLSNCDVGKWIVKKIVTDRYGNVQCTGLGVYDADSVPTSTMWRGNAQVDNYGYFYARIAKIIESPTLVTPSESAGTITYDPVVVPYNTNDTPLPIVTVPAGKEIRTYGDNGVICHSVPIVKNVLDGNSVIAKNIANKGGLSISISSSSAPENELDCIPIKSGVELIAGYYSGDYEIFPQIPEHIEPQPYDITLEWPITIRTINPDCSDSETQQNLSLHLKSMDCNNWQIGVTPNGSLTIDSYLPPIINAGDNISITQGDGRNITISATGGSGGDVPLAQYNVGGYVSNVDGVIAGVQVDNTLHNYQIRNGVIQLPAARYDNGSALSNVDGVISGIVSNDSATLYRIDAGVIQMPLATDDSCVYSSNIDGVIRSITATSDIDTPRITRGNIYIPSYVPTNYTDDYMLTSNPAGLIRSITFGTDVDNPTIDDGVIYVDRSTIAVQKVATRTNHGTIYQKIRDITTQQTLASTDIALDCNVTLSLSLLGQYDAIIKGFKFDLEASLS